SSSDASDYGGTGGGDNNATVPPGTYDDNFTLLASGWSAVFLLLGLLMVSLLLDRVRAAFQTAAAAREDQPVGVRLVLDDPPQQQHRGGDDDRTPLLRPHGAVTRAEVRLPHEW
ncbi:hypothetical protein HK405_013967, partial [Cladochytrium tenue]